MVAKVHNVSVSERRRRRRRGKKVLKAGRFWTVYTWTQIRDVRRCFKLCVTRTEEKQKTGGENKRSLGVKVHVGRRLNLLFVCRGTETQLETQKTSD